MRVHIDPDAAALAQFREADPMCPIACVNLLAFRSRAHYAASDPEHGTPAADVDGRTAYGRYGEVAVASIAAVGGRLLLGGAVAQMFIGPAEAEWEQVAIVYYPSRSAFETMLAEDRYRAATRHRRAGLANTRLIMLDGRAIPVDSAGAAPGAGATGASPT